MAISTTSMNLLGIGRVSARNASKLTCVMKMARDFTSRKILNALVGELGKQGQGGLPASDPSRLTGYPIKGMIDVVALAEAVQSALGGSAEDDDGKAPAELNAANDG